MTYNALVFYSPVTVAMEAVMRVRGPLNSVSDVARANMLGRIRYKSHGRLMTTLVDSPEYAADLFLMGWVDALSTGRDHDV